MMEGATENYRARLHTVEPETGLHQAFYVQRLGELTLDALQAQTPIYSPVTGRKYSSIHGVPNLAWLEFEDGTRPDYDTLLNRTHLVTGAHELAPHLRSYSLTPAANVLESRYLSPHTTGWLRPFLAADRPNPPIQANRTNVIRDVARFMPSVNEPR